MAVASVVWAVARQVVAEVVNEMPAITSYSTRQLPTSTLATNPQH